MMTETGNRATSSVKSLSGRPRGGFRLRLPFRGHKFNSGK